MWIGAIADALTTKMIISWKTSDRGCVEDQPQKATSRDVILDYFGQPSVAHVAAADLRHSRGPRI
jgi:hypothetical protein